MRVLVLGSGGREHALGWALARSASVDELVSAPGNPGLASLGEIYDCAIEDPDDVLALARKTDPDLVVVGPEAPLVAGISDALKAEGYAVFGPSATAARIEASKTYAKQLMDDAGIATARWRSFTDRVQAEAFMIELGPPYVIKADGLAAGKGVVVTEDFEAARAALDERMVEGRFGAAGTNVVIEEFLDGPECSLIAFTDGISVVPCEPAQDYKRVGDNDQGPNTGGMGSYSPVPACRPELATQIVEDVVAPMVRATSARGAPFVGAIYAGLALTAKGPRVVEFNARFGDPETQALLPRMRSDLGSICLAAARGELAGVGIEWDQDACVSVVAASEGYPGTYATGVPIEGVGEAEGLPGVAVFHAGTATRGSELVTSGGRVLAVSALGPSFAAARTRAYEAMDLIRFEGKQVRRDIALRAENTERTAV